MSFTCYPAIDVRDGCVVRLRRGDYAQETRYDADPFARAMAFADAGATWLHLVDLNGAIKGKPVNDEAVAAILSAISLPVQLGGGIRDIETIDRWLDAGKYRAEDVLDLMRRPPDGFFEAVPVGPKINAAANDGPSLQEPQEVSPPAEPQLRLL